MLKEKKKKILHNLLIFKEEQEPPPLLFPYRVRLGGTLQRTRSTKLTLMGLFLVTSMQWELGWLSETIMVLPLVLCFHESHYLSLWWKWKLQLVGEQSYLLRNSGFLKLSLRVMLSSLSEHFSKKDPFSFAYGHALDDTLLLASDFRFA